MAQNPIKLEKPSKRQRARDAVGHADVAALAYSLWEQHGCPHGQDVMDWLEAETILRKRRSAAD